MTQLGSIIKRKIVSKPETSLRLKRAILSKKMRLVKDGKTPVKGIDYFTPEEIDMFLKAVTPIKGIHYHDGRDGVDGVDGVGYAGKDGRDGIDGKDADEEKIIKFVLEELGKKKYTISDIEGLRGEIDAVRSKMMRNYGGHGGGLVKNYDLSSLLNGSSTSFTIPKNSFVIQITSSSAPFVFRPTVDYTVGGANNQTLTFTGIDAPTQLASGQTITIIYAV